MKTTKTRLNIELAEELLAVREELKLLTQREKELKDYFSNLIGTGQSLLVNTAITISKHEQSRSTYNAKKLDTYFTKVNLDNTEFKTVTNVNIIKIQKAV